jgi:hypothetical protein
MSFSTPQDKKGGKKCVRVCVCVFVKREREKGREEERGSGREKEREREGERKKVCELDRAIDYYARKNGRAPKLDRVHCCHSCGLKRTFFPSFLEFLCLFKTFSAYLFQDISRIPFLLH